MSMECIKCGCSCFNRMLHRTKPKGQEDGGWMCMPCIEIHEPEIAKELKSADDYQTVLDIEEAIISDNISSNGTERI